MFSNAEVIEASRKFVCVRIESYASEENQKIVRSHLNGSFANTAFCILAPDGKERLTRSGRGPRQVASGEQGFASLLDSISAKYESRGQTDEAAMPDFPSFKLALNVSSADQRVLMLLAGKDEAIKKTEKRLRSLVWNPNIAGRFHHDLDSGETWKEALALKEDAEAGIYLVKPDAFGLKGEVLERLALDVSKQTVATALTNANTHFAKTTEKKVYAEHVAEGRRQGIRIEMAMPFGEDRDGDGEIDRRGRRGNR